MRDAPSFPAGKADQSQHSSPRVPAEAEMRGWAEWKVTLEEGRDVKIYKKKKRWGAMCSGDGGGWTV